MQISKKFNVKMDSMPIWAACPDESGRISIKEMCEALTIKYGVEYAFQAFPSVQQYKIFLAGALVLTMDNSQYLCANAKGVLFTMDKDPFESTFEEILWDGTK